jgi:Fic family protein
MYIYEYPEWPQFTWNNNDLITLVASVKNAQGKLIGKMSNLGFELIKQANLEIMTQEVLKSSEIEGEFLDNSKVRSSICRRLGLEMPGIITSDKNVDGIVDMMIDATQNFNSELSKERLCGWHSSLFPNGFSGLYKISAGQFRDDSKGPMQVVSGGFGKEKVHYQAPNANLLNIEMDIFLNWFNTMQDIDLTVKSGIAHLWFVTLHPFDDGNGRIARALSDMLLTKSDNQIYRFYSMSSQILKERKGYYEILEKTQKGNLDITNWLQWFLNCLLNALNSSETILSKIIFKHNFWHKNAFKIENERQSKIINMLIDGFEGKLNTTKYAKICKCSQDTALRDIQCLISKNILIKLPGGGRSTSYELNLPENDIIR